CGLSVSLLRQRPAEYPAADDPVQHRPLLLHPLSDDEELPVQDERRLGDHSHAHGGQLAPDHPPGGH
ncbi:Helix-turn-helix conjugative transposon-like domain-containing protein, partial [Dysosmobacter welbionis]